MDPSIRDRRLLVLCTTTGYQTRAFVEAARKIGLSVVFGTDRCRVLEDPWRDGALPLRFENPEESAGRIVDYARSSPVDAIVALGDRPTPTAARACRALKLLCHPPEAADACRDKSLFRERLSAARVNAPPFLRFHIDADARELLPSVNERVGFPCVLKPLALSASRGVIRADDADQFIGAFGRIEQLLRSPEVRVMREDTSDFIQAEAYVEGDEVAVEGLVERGELRVLAIFDKPEPLVGPFFEETIYVTPSRLKPEIQSQVVETLGRAARALGLHHGPLHAEVRINSDGVWVLEVAARSIGGLCSRALRFSLAGVSADLSLEELLIRLALGEDVRKARREEPASGVMMIPIPAAGVFQGVEGVEEARRIPGVEEIHITVKPNEKLVPLPEGASYLGFIFARGPSPGFVEEALRAAHRKMKFTVGPELPVI
jgi:biotin carboxylase